MLERRVKVINRLGLHARAAAQLVQLASTFESRIVLTRIDRSANADAKSILDILTLAAAAGTELLLTIDGEDEADAFEVVFELFTDGFGEI